MPSSARFGRGGWAAPAGPAAKASIRLAVTFWSLQAGSAGERGPPTVRYPEPTPSVQGGCGSGTHRNVPVAKTPAPLAVEYQVTSANECEPRQVTGECASTWM